jgi:hypothetical protein
MAIPGENGQLVSAVSTWRFPRPVTCGLAKKTDTAIISFLSVFLAIVGRSPASASNQPRSFRIHRIRGSGNAHKGKSGDPRRPVSASRALGATDVPAIQCRPLRIDGMNRDGVRQAAQVLRTHVTSLGAHDHLAQVATVASLVYADRLNQPPIYPGDPNTVEEVSTRFSEILGDHLDLAAIILSAAAECST